ncbi:hypothetical protein F4561_003805 [Lipingzhangella halophila]|uniref:Uncharacterized protein n=1 Tax=Lipingzhangella halophila TaxID=1783352 RepID=A0A7W7W4Q8_9ACTN|nr:hypothetical protein [Lipingzhangella halophila]MBB4932985.1 hypothetical protein [Lipingzhangella halophila]
MAEHGTSGGAAHVEADSGGRYVEVWSDTVSLRNLVLSTGIILTLTMGGYLLAPGEPPQPLVFGLVGALAGFILCAVLFRAQRRVNVRASDEDDAAAPEPGPVPGDADGQAEARTGGGS